MLIATLVVSLLLCLGLALAVLYVVAAPHLRTGDHDAVRRLTARVDAAAHRVRLLGGRSAQRLQDVLRNTAHARRRTAEEAGSAHLPG